MRKKGERCKLNFIVIQSNPDLCPLFSTFNHVEGSTKIKTLIHRVMVECVVDLRAFQDTVFPTIVRDKGQETLFCLQWTYYPHLVHIFYANMHLVMVGVTFRVTMYGQSFLVSSCSIWYVLSMLKLEVFVPSFSPKVQALIRAKLDVIPTSLFGVLCLIPSYIPIVGFSKPLWLLATFFTHFFYLSSHCWSSAYFIHVILSRQQFDIGHVIFDAFTPLCVPFYQENTFLFALLIS